MQHGCDILSLGERQSSGFDDAGLASNSALEDDGEKATRRLAEPARQCYARGLQTP